MKNSAWVVLFVFVVGVMAVGCSASSTATPTSPSPTSGTSSSATQTIGSLSTGGTWASMAADPLPGTLNLNPGTCGNFKWALTSMTAVGAAGTFSANCGGGLSLAGNATATLNVTNVAWGATGGVTGSGVSCSFVVNGTAALETTGVRVNYTATVCGVTITGSELLKKR